MSPEIDKLSTLELGRRYNKLGSLASTLIAQIAARSAELLSTMTDDDAAVPGINTAFCVARDLGPLSLRILGGLNHELNGFVQGYCGDRKFSRSAEAGEYLSREVRELCSYLFASGVNISPDVIATLDTFLYQLIESILYYNTHGEVFRGVKHATPWLRTLAELFQEGEDGIHRKFMVLRAPTK